MTKSTEYIKEQITDYKPIKVAFDTLYQRMKQYAQDVIEAIKKRSVSNIDIMRELGLDLWTHIGLMKDEISIMNVYAEITQLKYKELLMQDGMDKFEAIDKSKLMYKTVFGDLDRYTAYVEWVGRLYTVIQGEVKSLLGDKRAGEFMNLD